MLFVQHTTCGLTINENADPDVKRDMLAWLRWLVPQYPDAAGKGAGAPAFRHFEHNSDAHIKSSLVGSSVTVPFSSGKLLLGRWQGIYLCEFDGPRERQLLRLPQQHRRRRGHHPNRRVRGPLPRQLRQLLYGGGFSHRQDRRRRRGPRFRREKLYISGEKIRA